MKEIQKVVQKLSREQESAAGGGAAYEPVQKRKVTPGIPGWLNKFSDKETPVELLSLEPQYCTEPLLITSISIIRHSEASSCCSPL